MDDPPIFQSILGAPAECSSGATSPWTAANGTVEEVEGSVERRASGMVGVAGL
jgi:hypothetical protein